MERIHLTIARPQDAPKIARMSRDLIERGLPWSWRKERVLRNMKRPDTLGVVARHEQAGIVGFAMMQYLDTSAHLLLFAIDLHLEVRASNEGARAFYSVLGYQEVALVPGYYQGRESAVRMMRNLSVQPESLLPP